MQSWDQVKVIAGEYEGQAGLVLRVDAEHQVATVKLDNAADPVAFGFAELQLLGR